VVRSDRLELFILKNGDGNPAGVKSAKRTGPGRSGISAGKRPGPNNYGPYTRLQMSGIEFIHSFSNVT